jgi:hypothetical protein
VPNAVTQKARVRRSTLWLTIRTSPGRMSRLVSLVRIATAKQAPLAA